MQQMAIGALVLLASASASASACGHGASADSAPAPTAPGAGAAPPTAAKVGAKVPALSLDSLTTPGQLVVVPGKVMVIELMATWNGPAKQSLPRLQELQSKYDARGLVVAAIAIDDAPDGVRDFVQKNGAKFPTAWDRGHDVSKRWLPSCVPTLYVIDREGVVRFVHCGWHDKQEDEIARELEGLF